MARASGDLDAVLADSFIDGLTEVPMDEVRARRAACEEIEVGLSYVRRLVQGRLDIVFAEARARSEGGAAAGDRSLADVVEQLPAILAPRVVGGGSGRLASRLEPAGDHRELTADLDRVIDVTGLGLLGGLSAPELAAVIDRLVALEQRVSAQRRLLHDRIDLVQAEIVRRYRSGEVSVDTLL